MIKNCACTHHLGNNRAAAYQDEKYGKSKRVANHLKREPKLARRYRCTVCGKVT